MNSEFEFSDFFHLTPDLVCVAGKDGFFRKVNPTVIETLGYSEQELFTQPISSFIYHEDRELTQQHREALINGKVLHNFVNRYQVKNGALIWLEWTSIYFSNKEVVLAIAKNITQRKIAEKEIEDRYQKFRNLATYFKKSIEKNKKYLAYQLHEELAQLVFTVKMDVDLLASNFTGLPESSKAVVEHALGVSKLIISTLQRISFSISPAMLDDFGLNTTLEWLCNEFSILNGIPCEFKSDYDEHSLSLEIKTDIFRICQEALTNVIEHAAATEVKIRIETVEENILLTIADNGNGFDVDQKKETPGLNSMQERADTINGQLAVQSNIGKGTTVRFSIAMQKNDNL
jgi:PAS domain S-box-containing protein